MAGSHQSPPGESISIQDALDIQNAAFMIPRAMTLVVQEGIEPLLIGEALRRSCTACACPPSPTSEQRGADVAGDCRERPQDNNHIGERRLSARRPSARPAAEDREEIRGRDQVSSSFRKKKPSRVYARAGSVAAGVNSAGAARPVFRSASVFAG